MHKFRTVVLLLSASVCVTVSAQHVPAAIYSDPPTDSLHPASMRSMHIPSHGAQLNAIMYTAAGAGPHPVVILLHGHPGNEKNLDLAQAIRRAGWNVLYFNYRGSWGSPGAFSVSHCEEDTAAAVDYLRDPANAAALHSDPKRIVLIGHSLGGLMAAYTAEHDSGIAAVGMISGASLDALPASAALLGTRPVLLITSDDGLAGQARDFAEGLRQHGFTQLTEKHFPTDHSYSDHRIALEVAVLNWLETMNLPQPAPQ